MWSLKATVPPTLWDFWGLVHPPPRPLQDKDW